MRQWAEEARFAGEQIGRPAGLPLHIGGHYVGANRTVRIIAVSLCVQNESIIPSGVLSNRNLLNQ